MKCPRCNNNTLSYRTLDGIISNRFSLFLYLVFIKNLFTMDKLMKLKTIIGLTVIISAVSGGAALAEQASAKATKKENRTKTLANYKTCDITALNTYLSNVEINGSKNFSVSEPISKDNAIYYEVKDTRFTVFDTDDLKTSTCEYIKQNNCYVYWNNAISTAKIATTAIKTVKVSPPVNLLSPIVGCHQK